LVRHAKQSISIMSGGLTPREGWGAWPRLAQGWWCAKLQQKKGPGTLV